MEKIAGQARNDRPAEGSVPAVHSSIRPFVHSSIRPIIRVLSSRSTPERSLRPDGHCGLDPQSFPSPKLSALFLRQYHFAVCFS
jgi:hypothetical protein